ncbi:hypothetical protein F8M41_018888 [Gigaspora margarita]|uniref:Restriction endonuclease type IV Mrr domain-containing protein n=1 Tax=Gigaspora margarita TaxID=4874 RepID=A0A8H4AKU7_GIGMA|nr:hypothetical protein F8M41_018888 [Gigaspora margarita]
MFFKCVYYYINNKICIIDDGRIYLAGCYNEIFFAIQVKFGTNHHFEQAEDIKKFDKALELQPKEVVGFFITTIEFSEETKKAVLESKRKIFLCNEENIISSIKKLSKFEIIKSETIFNDKVIINYKEINNKNMPIQSYLNELIRIKEILQNSKEKVFINTKNKNIYLMIKKNRIDKWKKNNWHSVNNKKIKASKEICIEIRNLCKQKNNMNILYHKK